MDIFVAIGFRARAHECSAVVGLLVYAVLLQILPEVHICVVAASHSIGAAGLVWHVYLPFLVCLLFSLGICLPPWFLDHDRDQPKHIFNDSGRHGATLCV
jgi:hypothetical protein